MTLQKAKEVVEYAEHQMILEDKGRFQDIKFTCYAIAKQIIKECNNE